jgi:hypothetical protein
MPNLESSRPTSPNHNTSVDSFKAFFEKIGHAFFSKKPLRLETLKNTSQNIRDWFHKFEIQTVQYDTQQKGYEVMMPSSQRYNYIHIKDIDILKVFKHNVNPEIAKQLVTAHFNSFDSLTQKARSIEKLIKASVESTTVESPIQPSTPTSITCY